jgi:hypothetical protein
MSDLRKSIRQALTEVISSLEEGATIEKKVAKKKILEKLGATDDKKWGVSNGGISVFQSNLSNIVDDMRKKGLLSTPSSDTYGHPNMSNLQNTRKAFNPIAKIEEEPKTRKAFNPIAKIDKVIEEPTKVVVDKPISFDNDDKIVLIEEPKKVVLKTKAVDETSLFEDLDEPKSDAERIFRGYVKERGLNLLNMAINDFVGKKGQGGCYGDYTQGDEACDGNPSCPLRGFCKKEKGM